MNTWRKQIAGICGALFAFTLSTKAQQRPSNEAVQQRKVQEAKDYYANADTVSYGVRYRFHYLYNKEAGLRYEEDRVTLVAPNVTLDMSYESIGERRWRLSHPEDKMGDRSLAYRLTPSYYFYYPENNRMVHTYRVISEEFLLQDTVSTPQWTLHEETKKIDQYTCRKATCTQGGREWTVWYTTELPYVAAPRTLTGLRGVVLEAEDADREVVWTFNGLVNHMEGDTLLIKFPDRFTEIPHDRFKQVVKLFALSEGHNYIQSSGVLEKQKGSYPEKFRPSTGVDACLVDNPINR